MELLLSMDKLLKTIKEICADGDFGVTYNELLLLLTLEKKHNTLKGLSDFLLIDKGYAYRVLTRLIKKEMIKKKGSHNRAEYYLTNNGITALREAYAIRDFIVTFDLKQTTYEELEKVKEIIFRHEKIIVELYSSRK